MTILRQVSREVFDAGRIVSALWEEDEHIYRELLQNQDQESFYLLPLRGTPDYSWAKLAILALDAGVPPQTIAAAAFREDFVQRGSMSDWYNKQTESWIALSKHPDARVRKLARIGKEHAQDSTTV